MTVVADTSYPMTPENVADLALAPEKLPLDRIALIGVRATPAGNSALVRLPDGAIQSLSEGADAGGMTVVAIGDDSLTLIDPDGATHRLTMPG